MSGCGRRRAFPPKLPVRRLRSRCLVILSLIVWLFSAAGTPAMAKEDPLLIHPDRLHYPPFRFSPPKPHRVVLDNGMILYILEDHELPLLHVKAVVRTGRMYDPAGLEGLAGLTGTVMRTGGTRKLKADDVNEVLDFMAATLEISTGLESTSIDLSVFTKDRNRGLDVFAQVLKEPAFEKERIDLAKDLEIEEIKRLRDDYQRLAFREFGKCFYRDDPRGKTATVSSVGRIGRGDLLKFHETFFWPANIMMAVTGDISTGEALSLIRRHFGEWTGKEKRPEPFPAPEKQPGGIHYFFKEVPQSAVIAGYPAPGRSNDDYYAFEVLDFIIGSGGFRSLIVQKIRSDLGLAYSAGSFYRVRSDHGIFAAYAMTKSSSTMEVLSLLRDIVQRELTKALDEERLAWAKRSIVNSFIFSFQSARQIAGQALMMEFEGLPADYLERYRERIDRVQLSDLRRVAGKYLSGEAVTLILGDQRAFGQPLDRFGPVDVLPGDPDG